MATTYTVAPGHEFNYPADAASEALIKRAGGRSKLSEEDRGKVKFKTVTGGKDCSDMPVEVRTLYVERGWVIEYMTNPIAEKIWKDLGDS